MTFRRSSELFALLLGLLVLGAAWAQEPPAVQPKKTQPRFEDNYLKIKAEAQGQLSVTIDPEGGNITSVKLSCVLEGASVVVIDLSLGGEQRAGQTRAQPRSPNGIGERPVCDQDRPDGESTR